MKMVKDPKINKTYMLPDFDNEEQEEKFFNKLKNLTNSDEHITYGIYLEDRLIGFINDVRLEPNIMEVGYFIDSDEWNKGYATEALWEYMKQIFSLGIYTVEAAYFEGNDASGKVMYNCLMRPSGKEEIISYRGKEHKAIYYSVTRKQFLPVYHQ